MRAGEEGRVTLSLGIWSALCAVTGLTCPEEADLSVVTPEPVALVEGQDGAISLPSGLVVKELETLLEPVGVPTQSVKTIRLRYVAEMLEDSERWGFDTIEGDFAQLCHSFGLERRARSAPNATHVIVSIASEPTAFGDSVPQIVQYFDSYTIVDNACIWEG